MRYAIIEEGSKQYCVEEGSCIDVELPSERREGDPPSWQAKKVLFFRDADQVHIASPHLEHVNVKGEWVDLVKGPKVLSFKFKRRKGFRKKIGHRQSYARLRITSIEAS